MTVPVTTSNQTSGQILKLVLLFYFGFGETVIQCLTDFVNGRTIISPTTTNSLEKDLH